MFSRRADLLVPAEKALHGMPNARLASPGLSTHLLYNRYQMYGQISILCGDSNLHNTGLLYNPLTLVFTYLVNIVR